MKLLTRALNSEVRAPQVATQQTGYSSSFLGQGQVAEWDAENAITYAYLANVVVYRCVQIIANDIASLPFRAGKNPEKKEDFNQNAPLARLLGPPPGGPSPSISARSLWRSSVAQRIVTGRMAWELETGSQGQIVAIWPLLSRLLKPIPSDGGTSLFKGFEYGEGGKTRKLSADKIFYDWLPSLKDLRQPESPLQAARLDISVAVMQDQYDHAFLKNDSRPAAMVVTQMFAETKERDRFRSQFEGNFGGPDNAGKMAFAEVEGAASGPGGLVHIETLGLSQRDAEFIRRHEQKFRNIAIALGVPFSKLDASNRKFLNSEVEDRTYWIDTVKSLALELADAVNMQIAPRLGPEIGWFDFGDIPVLKSSPLLLNPQTPQYIQAGVFTVDEVRAEVGLAPLKIPPPEPEPVTEEPTEKPQLELVRSNLEKMWIRSLKVLFSKQEKAALSRLEGKRGRQFLTKAKTDLDVSAVYDQAFWEAETKETVRGLYEALFAASGSDLEAASEFIDKRAGRFAEPVTRTTFDALEQSLAEGVKAGEDQAQLSERIRQVFRKAEQVRAQRIARAEIRDASEEAA